MITFSFLSPEQFSEQDPLSLAPQRGEEKFQNGFRKLMNGDLVQPEERLLRLTVWLGLMKHRIGRVGRWLRRIKHARIKPFLFCTTASCFFLSCSAADVSLCGVCDLFPLPCREEEIFLCTPNS
jgi:hypothetical protein